MRSLAALVFIPLLLLGGGTPAHLTVETDGAPGQRLVTVDERPTVAAVGRSAEPGAERSTVSDGTWSWPVEGPRRVLRPFLAPPVRWGAGHRGVDLAAGATLLAPADGVVSFAGVVVDRGVLSIDHGGGIVSSYEPVTALVAAGESVTAGEPIATIEAGHCASPCLHLGVRVDGEYANPLRWLGGVPRSVLLPTRTVG